MRQADHRTVLAGLPVTTRRALHGRRDAPGLIRIGVHLGLIFGLGAAIAAGVPFWPLALVAQGIAIVFLFTALHETIHATAFRTPWLNDWTAQICGFAVFLGPVHFRYFHLAHHRFTHDPQNDPELATPKPVTRWQYAVYLTGLPESASRVKTLLSTAVVPNTDPFVPARGRAKIRREARIMLALYVVAFGLLPQTLLWAWLVPYAAGAPFLRAYLLAEHAFCPNVANMLENTRTTFTARLVRWIAWNMPYHTEHHADPAVPFHQLPAFHRILKPHLINTEQGYTRFAISYVERSGKAQTDASQPSLQNR